MIRVRQIKVPVLKNNPAYLKNCLSQKIKIPNKDILDYSIVKLSIDARDKRNIFYVYELNVNIKEEEKLLKRNKSKDIFLVDDEKYRVPKKGNKKLKTPIVIVGSGPAGLFSALLLIENGYKPIVIERGEKIEQRILTVEKFWKTGILNENSNVQFGEGGAGTFSDGKLNTLVHDKSFRNQKVLETFVKYGAPKEILYLQKPHIGTDILRKVIINMRNAILHGGGSILYNSCLTDLFIEDNQLKAIQINNETKIDCQHLVLAIGHSARDTFSMIYNKKIKLTSKPFAIGIRIEHPQSVINESQYGDFAKFLPPATYKLTYNTPSGRGVYSFCMCPGGYVVNASSEKNRLTINGMSNAKRDSKNANSALVVTIYPKDFGMNPFDGMNFQRTLEQKAYEIGKGKIPVQLYKDFLNNQVTKNFGNFQSEIKGGYTFSNLNELFPDYIIQSLKEAIPVFGKRIAQFDMEDAILSGIESRTSSPVRIYRDENYESNIKGIYPCGEGAGYAGGITTSAIDGIRVAESIIQKYSNV